VTAPNSSAAEVFVLVVERDLRLALRRPGEWLQPVAFFAIVTVLFPLALNPEAALLRALAPGALWVAALLSSLLAIEFLYREDGRDGTLEQFALSGQSFALLLFAKTVAHWLLTGVPLAIAAPLAALALGAPTASLTGVLSALLLGSVSLSLIGTIGAGLTLGVRRGGALLSLLVLPLSIPALVFGARATALAIEGAPGAQLAAPLYLLGALAVLGVTLAPLAAAAAVRISLE
jgi:heme exporter protein B